MTSYLSNRQSTADLYAADEMEYDAKELMNKNRNVLWKIFEYYCPHTSQIPQLTSDPQSALYRRSKPLVPVESIPILFKDWDVLPSLVSRVIVTEYLDSLGQINGNSKISFDQFCDLLLLLSMEVAIQQSNRFICFFDDEKEYREMMIHVIKDTHPLDFPATACGLRVLLTVMDRSNGRRKFERSRAATIVPPFVNVEGASAGIFDSFTQGHRPTEGVVDDGEFQIEPLSEKSKACLHENESILVSMALRYSIPPGQAATGAKLSPKRLSYYSLVEDTGMYQSKRQSVLVPFDGLWRLLNDFGACPEVVSKETLREIHDRVRSSTANSNNTDVFAEENEEEDLEEAQGITYDQFEIIIGVIAQIGHRLGSQHLPAEIRMRQLFTKMNHSPGRARLIEADRSAPVIPPLYDEERVSFKEYVARATSPTKGRYSSPTRVRTGEGDRDNEKEEDDGRCRSAPSRYSSPSRSRRSSRSASTTPSTSSRFTSSHDTPVRTGGRFDSPSRRSEDGSHTSTPTTDRTHRGGGRCRRRSGEGIGSTARMSSSDIEPANFTTPTQQMTESQGSIPDVQETPLSSARTAASTGSTTTPTPYGAPLPHPSHHDITKEVLEFELNEENPLIDELKRLHLLERPSKREERLNRDGKWCPVTRQKLDVLQWCLQNLGTEEEWKEIFNHNDFILLEYLLSFMNKRVNRILMDGACRCLAYANLVHESLWLEFVTKAHSRSAGVVSWHMVRIAVCVAMRVSLLLSLPPSDLPIDGRESTSQKEKKKHRMETAVTNTEAIAIWKLVLTNVFQVQNCQAEDTKFFRQESGGCRESVEDQRRSEMHQAKEVHDGKKQIKTLCRAARELIIASRDCRDMESATALVKAIAMINYHLPNKSIDDELDDFEEATPLRGTEISRLIGLIQYSEKNTANEEGCGVINLSEGILNCINDMSYPGHDTPELNPVIKLCCDLLQEREHHGYFYANDQKVLTDIAVREIHNIPFNQDSVETRYRFLQLLHDLMLSLEMKYRAEDILKVANFVIEHDEQLQQQESSDTQQALFHKDDRFDVRALADNVIADLGAYVSDLEAKREAARLAAEVAEREAARLAAEEAEREAARVAAEEAEREAARVAAEEAEREAARVAAEEAEREAARVAAEEAEREAARVAAEGAEREAARVAAEEAKKVVADEEVAEPTSADEGQDSASFIAAAEETEKDTKNVEENGLGEKVAVLTMTGSDEAAALDSLVPEPNETTDDTEKEVA